jgi:hypothetical protein
MFKREPDPLVDRPLVRAALRADGEHSGHRPRRHEIPGASVRAIKVLCPRPRVEPNYQIVTIHAAAHVSADHKCQASEHRLFNHVRPTLQRAADASGKSSIIRHRSYSSCSGEIRLKKEF